MAETVDVGAIVEVVMVDVAADCVVDEAGFWTVEVV